MTKTMTRKELYNAIWQKTMRGFAEEEGLNYSMLVRAVTAAEIPKPNRKEIALIKRGEEGLKLVTRPPLPGNPRKKVKVSLRNEKAKEEKEQVQLEDFAEEKDDESLYMKVAEQIPDYEKHPRWKTLYFLNPGERMQVIRETEMMAYRPQDSMHPVVERLRKDYAVWLAQLDVMDDPTEAKIFLDKPFLFEKVSEFTLPRVFRLMDHIYRAVEALGGSVNQDGSVCVHGERLDLRFRETKARAPRALTIYEERELERYKKALQTDPKKAKKPQINQYDMVYTGTLILEIALLYQVKDTKTTPIEKRLGDVLEYLYTAAYQQSMQTEQNTRKDRYKQERYAKELAETEVLIQKARDYDDAARIRRLIAGVQKKLAHNELSDPERFSAWASWASGKAAWLDPTVAKQDKILGKRHDPILVQKR